MKQNINNANLSTFTKELAIWKVGLVTRDCWRDLRIKSGIHLIGEAWNPKGRTRDPRPSTQLIGGTRDPRPWTLKVDFQKIFSVFSKTWRLWMNSCALCVFICLSLPYHKAYTVLIFYHLNELLFPSFCKNFKHGAVMKSLNFRQN